MSAMSSFHSSPHRCRANAVEHGGMAFVLKGLSEVWCLFVKGSRPYVLLISQVASTRAALKQGWCNSW
jgi:hypothetical protein